ncbi:Hint domain-containing protein [Ruegeria sediminis]|uniref:Hint domain-containing protein n=1 Tax=Ruegeria sediminis TaxID=2583820 RepID=A0ABY2X3X9_9RHOB|nr:Hint domain-containing protein [Ruegeria sediminis]TMV09749.1 Hint domain-containing protein [Ruegeria sediminis]
MANYSIFMLGESQITVSGGQQLDGITQGDGSHLVGHTITLNSRAWTEVFISDQGSDTDFEDNDGNQVLNGAQTIDGTNFASGTRVEAEFGITLTDGTNTWQAIAFNVNNSSPSFATVEGLAFIGGPGGFPPDGVPLTVVSAQEGPSFPAANYATPICYCGGTRIATDSGDRAIEDLGPGDRVWTRDDGFQTVLWTGGQDTLCFGRFAPVEIPAGLLGNDAPLRVSQQHRLLIGSAASELLFGAAEVFVPAISLVDAGLARVAPVSSTRYYHLLLERHSVIRANGAASESLFLSERVGEDDPDRLFFPELAAMRVDRMTLARPGLTRREAVLLLRETFPVDSERLMRHTSRT